MITLRRARERHHTCRREHESWLTFHSKDGADWLAGGFGSLESLNEDRLPPGAVVSPAPHREAETITYACEGALAYEDSRGGSGVIQAGEFQRMTSARGIRHNERNASRTDWAHIFQMSFSPWQAELEPGREQKRFSAAQRRGGLCVIASPDGRRGSLCIHQDALMYSALLERGQHIVHELSQGRSAWLHLVQGEVTLDDTALTSGDGAAITAERAVSLTAREGTEILLFDLGQRPELPCVPGRSP